MQSDPDRPHIGIRQGALWIAAAGGFELIERDLSLHEVAATGHLKIDYYALGAVSTRRRAAISAPAASSPDEGSSARTIRASTKSIAPSPFLSCQTSPGLKKSESAAGAISAGAVRPIAPAPATTTTDTRSRFM